MTRTSTLVRAARKSSRVTQAELAQKSRVYQSNISEIENGRDLSVSTLEKLLDATGHRLFALPLQKADVIEAARAIRGQLTSGNRYGALKTLIQLNDNLVCEHGLLRGVLGLGEPEPTGSPVWDAALAGLVAWRLGEGNIPLPGWVDNDRFFLSRPSTLDIDPADPIPSASDIHSEFARRGVLVWEDTFASV